MAFRRLFAPVALTLLAAASSCKTAEPAGSAVKDDQPVTTPEAGGPRLCAGIRGNGNLIAAHWTALARILENYGMIEGTAGGSSGSITQFIYESIYANPLLRQCASGACSDEEAGARAGLLMKSLQ